MDETTDTTMGQKGMPDWYVSNLNLAELWAWLRARGEEPDDPAYFMEKPWKWQPEWEAMMNERHEPRERDTQESHGL